MSSGKRESRASSGPRGPWVQLWDRNFPARAPSYLFQCGLATGTLFLILLVEDAVLRAAIVVAVASTAFTIFVFPNSVASTPRKVIGGHATAVLSGSISAAILQIPAASSWAEESRYVLDIMAAAAVGVGLLIMVGSPTPSTRRRLGRPLAL